MKYRMTRGDFEFMWHYRDRAGDIVVKVLKNAGYATSRVEGHFGWAYTNDKILSL